MVISLLSNILVSNIAKEHQHISYGEKDLQKPDWTDRQADHIQPVHKVAGIAQYNVSQAV
jgi:hypothetical protein